VFGPDDVLWGSAPGQGPELRNAVERETDHPSGARRRRHRTWPGLWLIGIILFLFFILFPIFAAWDFISPRSFREFTYGPHPIFVPAKYRPHPLSSTGVPRTATAGAGKTRQPPKSE
jgi:hypothetical protein